MLFDTNLNPVLTGNLPEYATSGSNSGSVDALYLGDTPHSFSGTTYANAVASVREYSIDSDHATWLASYEADPTACVEITYTDDDGNDAVAYLSYSSSASTWLTVSTAVALDGDDGEDGDDAPNVIIQYSEDGTSNWSTTATDDSVYWRTSVDGGTTWSAVTRWKGEAAEDLIFEYSVDGSSDWHTTMTTDDYFWRWSTDGGTTYSSAVMFRADSEGLDSLTTNMQTQVQSMIDASAPDTLTDNQKSEVQTIVDDSMISSLTQTMTDEVQAMIDASQLDSLTDNMEAEVQTLIENNGMVEDDTLAWDTNQTIFNMNTNLLADPTTDAFYIYGRDNSNGTNYPMLSLGDLSTPGTYELFMEIRPGTNINRFVNENLYLREFSSVTFDTALDGSDGSITISSLQFGYAGFGLTAETASTTTTVLTMISDGTFVYSFVRYYGTNAPFLTSTIGQGASNDNGISGTPATLQGQFVYIFSDDTDIADDTPLKVTDFRYRFTAAS